MLPLCPPEDIFWSPYSGLVALCGNTLIISLDELVADGLLTKADLPEEMLVTTADFSKVCKLFSYPEPDSTNDCLCVRTLSAPCVAAAGSLASVQHLAVLLPCMLWYAKLSQ